MNKILSLSYRTMYMARFYALMVSIMIVLFLLVSGHFFLQYSNAIQQSDIAVVFVGPQFKNRVDKAFELISKGYLQKIYVPAYGIYITKENVYTTLLARMDNETIQNNVNIMLKNASFKFFEQTHIEVILAKDHMDKIKACSAVFISSSYHMRRIKLISEIVYKNSNKQLFFIPSVEASPHLPLWLNKNDIQFIFTEYGKICWFLLYNTKPFIFFTNLISNGI
ncbi:MAG: YdcF family protein [Desulfamplus sp.]|nr:YdcF family protein [Desulfamplus sp.]